MCGRCRCIVCAAVQWHWSCCRSYWQCLLYVQGIEKFLHTPIRNHSLVNNSFPGLESQLSTSST